MSPLDKVRMLVLLRAKQFDRDNELELPDTYATADDIDVAYDKLTDEGAHWDAISEVREGECETDIKCEVDRNYESKSVAAQLPDGSWVGWTYWYGGGKHGNPDEIEWMEYAYDLQCVEKQEMVTTRTFTKGKAKKPKKVKTEASKDS